MRKRNLKYKIGIFILLLTFIANAQNSKMEYNRNLVNRDFVASSEQKEIIKLQVKTENNLSVFLEKSNDSIFSIYLFNKTTDSIKISSQDEHLYLIQEAKNQDGEWKPIEYWKYSSCGSSYMDEKLKTNGILKTESKVYDGGFETQIRFKLLNDNANYYSNPITGYVDLAHFNIPNNITEYNAYKLIEKRGSWNLLKKVIFLEPNAMKEYNDVMETFLENLKKKKRN